MSISIDPILWPSAESRRLAPHSTSCGRLKLILACMVLLLLESVVPSRAVTFQSFDTPIAVETYGGISYGFDPPTPDAGFITAGPDENLWFTDTRNHVGMITPGGIIAVFTTPTPGSQTYSITSGPDGNVWFTEPAVNKIGRILTNGGSITEFPVPTPNSTPWGITAGPDGNLWFTESVGSKIGQITPAGVITEFPLPNGGSYPTGITLGPDGSLWFTEQSGNRIGRVTPAGVISEFPAGGGPTTITPGPDGNLWFTEQGANKIGRITTAGVVTAFGGLTGSGLVSITAGPDRALWFSETNSNLIGRIAPGGGVTEFANPTIGPSPERLGQGITLGPDGNLWFTEYSVKFTSSYGGCVGCWSHVTLTTERIGVLNPKFDNDIFANSQNISGIVGVSSNSSYMATKEPGEPIHAVNAGGASVWFKWTAPFSGNVTFSTAGSDFDTLLAVYTGSYVDSLTAIASNDDDLGGGVTSKVTFATTPRTTYYIAVDGKNGATGNITLNWRLSPFNDNFANAQPISGASGSLNGLNSGATKEPGEPLHGGSPGGASVWYQWTPPQTGTVTFTTGSSTFSTLLGVYRGASVSSLTTVAGGTNRVSFNARVGVTYFIAVDGSGGQTGTFSLYWLLYPPPPNDNFANAQVITGPYGQVTGVNVSATKEPGEPNHAGDPGGTSVWYSWTAPYTGSATFTTRESSLDTLLAVYTGSSVNSLTPIASNDDDPAGGKTSKVTFNATVGTTYFIAVDGYSGAFGGIVLYWSPNTFYWGAGDLAVGPDNKARLLWSNLVGRTLLWNVDNQAGYTFSPIYGPFPGWTSSHLAIGADSIIRLLWNHVDGRASLWLLDSNGNSPTSHEFGPYAGWTAVDVAVGSDNQARLLWSYSTGGLIIWTIDNNGNYTYGPIYGPYTGWTASRIATGADGLTRVLWNNTDGRADMWLLNPDNTYQIDYPYGPYPGWTAIDITAGSDNKARILWQNTDGRMALWSVDNANVVTNQAAYGPYPGWTPKSISAGPDGTTWVLWNKSDGTVALWLLNNKNVYQRSFGYGPY